ncbi:hypothetical protein COY17_03185 [Candidatus Saccharibacteria bacterium CG_4_10_14_0_2_um_filter_52_9]|nr:MAG: hypothetical protein COY17_03185 [Candidatus Saccharibacteria bacterium CG_4_10_14_0_2_um_filter_52_9]
MKLFNRQKNLGQTAVEEPDYISNTTRSRGRIDWKRAIPRLIVLIVIPGLIVFGILLLAGVAGKDNSPPATPAKPIAVQKATKPPAPAPTPTSAPASNSGTAGASVSQASPNVNSQSLTDTGPGETALVFVTVSIAGAAAYQIILRRNLASR